MSTERRTLTADLEVREAGSSVTVEGYASTFNQPYDMGLYRETVAPGAFRKTLQESPDVRFLINHDGLPLARTTSGTLELSEDSQGLHMRASLDPADPDVARIVPKMQRGDLTQMSFAFRTIKDEWSQDYTERTMKELSLRDGDVSLVTYPANPNATAKMRAARDAVAAAPLLARIVSELRAGNDLTPATFSVLESILARIAAADMELDQALVDLSGLVGVTNPDEDAMADDETPESEAPEAPEAEVESDAIKVEVEVELPRSLSPRVKAQALAAALAAHRSVSKVSR